jgi:phosphomannomutase
VAGYATWLKKSQKNKKVVTGRDGRVSGEMVSQLAIQTLRSMGIDVVDLGLSTTPTVEMMVSHLDAGGGIIFTASHNPKEWNALKFLNEEGEFISAQDGREILDIIESGELTFSDIDHLGMLTHHEGAIDYHIGEILKSPYVEPDKIKSKNWHVVVDCINSTGAIAIPPLLEKLGVEYSLLNDTDFGHFAHNPEPLPQHLKQLSEAVVQRKADLGISVDPDVDRLAFVCEDGSMFGEEYTLVAIADFIMSQKGGHAVSNLSSTRALEDVAHRHNGTYSASAVGEVNVVEEMKKTCAVIGGEGNGGVIVPGLHYGRDAMAGLAIFLTHLAYQNISASELRDSYPQYIMIKDKIVWDQNQSLEGIFIQLTSAFHECKINSTDGLKVDFPEGWVHLRKSNTEPIIRIYAEGPTEEKARELIDKVKHFL